MSVQLGKWHVLTAALCVFASTSASAGEGVAPASAVPPSAQVIRAVDPYFARVNGRVITIRDYRDAYAAAMRKRFYHGKPPEAEAEAVRKEISDKLIERELVIEDAEKKGLQADDDKIKRALDEADKRNSANPNWQSSRVAMLPALKLQLTRDNLYEQNEKILHEVPPPAKADVRAYYEKKPDLFTEPMRQRISLILLEVDPGLPSQEWEKTRAKAKEIYQRIKDGADFAEMAKQYSTHASAKSGGDMGYVHRGMLPDKIQSKFDQSKIGELTEPFTILEGVVMYRLDERTDSRLQDFSAVESRAGELLRRELGEQAWKEALERLHAAAKIEMLVSLSDDGGKAKAK